MTAEEFLGKTPTEVSPSQSARLDASGRPNNYPAAGEDHHRQIMQTGQPIEVDEDYLLPNGEKLFVHVIKLPVLSSDGKIVGTQGIQFNITERKRAEEQMNLQSSALTAAANSIVITNRAGIIEWVNPAFTKSSGYAAAEAIGKGREVPWFKVEGSSEVRQAGAALMVMRDRLKRQIAQRTAMLAGVSHDLRTPLTRMRLQIELMGANPDTSEISSDIAEMEEMLNAYLAFARGEETEATQPTDIGELLEEIAASARRQHPNIDLRAPQGMEIIMRRNAMKRCLTNLVGNALRYGSRAEIRAETDRQFLTITIDDDGPGITPPLREEMFRPFTRAEESRNPATGGIGLGLTIARDIARSHGGDVVLEDSPLGGLRARVWMPI